MTEPYASHDASKIELLNQHTKKALSEKGRTNRVLKEGEKVTKRLEYQVQTSKSTRHRNCRAKLRVCQGRPPILAISSFKNYRVTQPALQRWTCRATPPTQSIAWNQPHHIAPEAMCKKIQGENLPWLLRPPRLSWVSEMSALLVCTRTKPWPGPVFKKKGDAYCGNAYKAMTRSCVQRKENVFCENTYEAMTRSCVQKEENTDT